MNKKRLLAIIITAICACILSSALVGCGGDPKANYVGSWELESIEDSNLGHVDTAILKQMGMEIGMNLNEDGSGEFIYFGESIDATWSATSATSMTLTLSGAGDIIFNYTDGKLVGETDGSSMTFAKASA